ncbi:ABC transporter substrate-binding protein [Leptothermofonsia sichuanensis E412]|uniref:ABC transporter substrate-binding protein n=1 Tax=Leptothermofonsia sichuanensis TaxID=2917832 RepID=UPI001CA7103E|nr:ABC transporter substrate-binding protein [Leptothermofonsia sichuanensis]QZZ21756.1 ABC transporter substrate-binding protein [Leptothermofonsia sichuanensis E412]
MKVPRIPRRAVLFSLFVAAIAFSSACSRGIANSPGSNSSQDKVIRIAIGTQDQVINTATGGSVIREEKLLEKHLPKTGKYANIEYNIEWSSYTSGPPITNKMLANQIDIGMMGDFPATINMTTFQQKGEGVKTLYIATLGYGATGAGNAVMVPKDSPVRTLTDLKGKQVSVPFGSAAHGMLLKALKENGLDPDKDLKLISQAPEVGGASLRTNQIDAHANFVPFGELFSFRGFARKIFDGAQTNVPTFHGVLVRSDFAEKYPEVVVAYLKALLEANQLFKEQPEAIATKIGEWSGVEREVVYMFLGPNGLQRLNPTIRQVNFDALKNSVVTLKQLQRLDASVNPEDVTKWADESFLKQAMQEMGLSYDTIAANDEFPITGEDALTKKPIKDAKLAAQIWVQGEDNVMNFASVKNMMGMLQKLKTDGKKVVGAIFVHDFNQGWKLFAENSFFVRQGDNVAAFLTEKDAQVYADKVGAEIASFKNLQAIYAQEMNPAIAAR